MNTDAETVKKISEGAGLQATPLQVKLASYQLMLAKNPGMDHPVPMGIAQQAFAAGALAALCRATGIGMEAARAEVQKLWMEAFK